MASGALTSDSCVFRAVTTISVSAASVFGSSAQAACGVADAPSAATTQIATADRRPSAKAEVLLADVLPLKQTHNSRYRSQSTGMTPS